MPASARLVTARVVSLTSRRRSAGDMRRRASTWRSSISAVLSADRVALRDEEVGSATRPSYRTALLSLRRRIFSPLRHPDVRAGLEAGEVHLAVHDRQADRCGIPNVGEVVAKLMDVVRGKRRTDGLAGGRVHTLGPDAPRA